MMADFYHLFIQKTREKQEADVERKVRHTSKHPYRLYVSTQTTLVKPAGCKWWGKLRVHTEDARKTAWEIPHLTRSVRVMSHISWPIMLRT